MKRRELLRLAAVSGMAGAGVVGPGRRVSASATRRVELVVDRGHIVIDGDTMNALTIGGSVPGPVLRWREGEEVEIHVVNRLDEPTSIHWHGLLVAGVMDGAPGFNAFAAIGGGQTRTYNFVLRQAGTYWYHSHSGGQEQLGMYGAIVIEPAAGEKIPTDQDHVVVLSDHTAEDPDTILRRLKTNSETYVRAPRTVLDFFRDAARDGLGAAIDDRLMWGGMRMSPTDLADVTGYRFLINGKGPGDNWTGTFKPGQRVRLRIINASAMTFFDVRIPDLKMTVINADGQDVLPVPVDEIRIGIGESYDVLVNPRGDRAFTIMAEPIDRTGYARGTLAPRPGMVAEIPPQRPRALLTMADMGHSMEGMDHGSMAPAGGAPMAGMNHAGMSQGGAPMAGMNHAGMSQGSAPMAGMNHAGMSQGGAPMAGMNHAGMSQGGAPMAGMNHGAMPAAGAEASADAPLMGWGAAGTEPGKRALRYEDLKSQTVNQDSRPPTREIRVELGGQMGRYIWTMNGKRFDQAEPIRASYGERLRIRYVNTTMMAHPMHLHGMFVELENGQTNRRPLKHVTIVPPGSEVSVLLTANEPGDWPFHCHLLYHMNAGMMARFIVEPRPRETAAR